MSEHEYHSTPASSSSSSSPDYIRAPTADAGQSDLRDRYDTMTYAHYDAADYEGHDRVSDSSPGPYPADASSASDFERVSSLAQSLSCRSPILTSSPLYRHLRSGALPQTQPPGTDPYPHSAIPAPIQNFTEQDGRHVPPLLVNGVSPSSTAQFQLEQAALHRYSTQVTQQNVSLDNYVARLRTPHSPVFNVSDLAAQHELPQSFPQPPCTAPQRTASNPQQQHIQPSSSTDSESLLEFYRMRNQYLQMHQEKVESPAAGNAQLPNVSPEDAAMAIADLFQGDSPAPSSRRVTSELTRSGSLSSTAGGVSDMWGGTPMLDESPGSAFLTSPFDSPLDDFLQTPQTAALSMPDIFTSPAQGAPFDSFETPLFDINKQPLYAFPTQEPAIDPSIVSSPSSGTMLHQFPTPVVAAPDNTRATKNGSITASSSAAAHRRNNPTGTRKNATPETLVPLDAPIQPRKYVTPSQTSRKEVPATFARKRARSQAFGEDDELAAEDVGSSEQPSKDEEEAIKQKRLQNTLAARRSRKRKLEYQRELEDTIEIERKEKEQWKSHALVLEALLVDKGFAPPPRPAI